jgi:acyl CoA:acetate/3-ketoacid CoA transferase
VLAQSEFPLLVSPQLKTIDANLFHPEPIKLKLRPAMEAMQ